MSHPTETSRPQGGCDERAFWKRGVVGWWLWLAGRVSSSPQRRPCRAPRQQGRRAAPLGRLQRQGGLQPESRGRSAWQGGVGRPTHSTVERAEFHIAIGAPGFGVLVMWALRGGATSEMPGRAAALPASAPNWRRAESNLERAPQVGVNLESTSASWSQPGVALKTWSQHLKPGASSLQLERARSNWSELAPSWSEVGASGASEKKFSNVGPPRTTARGLWPAPPAASISKPTSAVGQTKRAHKHETVRDLVRAREEQLHHTSDQSFHANANCAWPRCVLTLTLSTRSHRASRRTHPGRLAQQTPSRARSTRRQTCF